MSGPAHHPTLAVPADPADHSQGPLHAPLTLIEYGDFECPSCKVAVDTPKLLLERFPNRIRYIFRHFPLEEAHPHALRAAESAEAAAAQGRFWEMHDVLFAHQDHLGEADLKRHAASAGLDVARFEREMAQRLYLQRVREQAEGGRRSHLRATPTFFLDGVVQDISFGLQALHDAVAAAVRHLPH
jgi:protein-disulfide isomerase